MNRRAFRLVLFSLVVATVGALVAPGVAIADPIGDKQAEAAQLEAQINSNAEKLSGLNERINSAQNELDQAEADIRAADALVEAAKAKTRELRDEVARRAAVVYTQSGSTGGVEELDAQNAQDLSTRQKYSSLAAQRDQEIVHSLAKAKEQVTERKADAENGAPGRAAAAGRHQGTEGEARRRPGRARAAAVEGHRRDSGARGAGRAGTSGP